MASFFSGSVPQFRNLFELRTKLLATVQTSRVTLDLIGRKSVESLTKHVLTFGKFFRRLQQPAIPRFVALPCCSDLVLYYWQIVVDANSAPAGYTDGAFSRFTCAYRAELRSHLPATIIRLQPSNLPESPLTPGHGALQGLFGPVDFSKTGQCGTGESWV